MNTRMMMGSCMSHMPLRKFLAVIQRDPRTVVGSSTGKILAGNNAACV